jgi:DNA polymerase-3 subunit alpha
MLHDIVQLAFIPVIDGVEKDHFNEFCQPRDFSTVDAGAVAVHGITVDQMRTFQSPEDLFEKLVARLKPYGCKFVLAGYNVNFDKGFLGSFFAKLNATSTYRELFSHEIHDTYVRAKSTKEKISSHSLKLEALAKEFSIEIKAHDALSDIRATMLVDKHISRLLGDDDVEYIFANDIKPVPVAEPALLHLHSAYSNTDSVVSVDDWVRWAYRNKIKTLAFPDHGLAASLFHAINASSVIENINKLDKISIPKDAVQIVPAISINVSAPSTPSHFRMNAWAITEVGYYNLVKLASMGWENPVNDQGVDVAVVPIESVRKCSEGVIFGTADDKGLIGCLSLHCCSMEVETVARSTLEGLNVVGELLPFDVVKSYQTNFGFRPFPKTASLEDGNLTAAINRVLAKMADKGLPLIVSTAAHFISPDDKILQDVVSKSSFSDHRYFYESRHHRPIAECAAILRRHLGEWFTDTRLVSAVDKSYEIANAASGIKIKYDYHLPAIEIPPEIKVKTSDFGRQLYYLLMLKIKEHGRWNDSPEYIERFKKELDVIAGNSKLNFLPYFLVYEDIGRFARSQGILQGIARGSAGGCLISYYLKIIHIDPIAEKLPFERFLSHARINGGSFPDIDVDFGQREPIVRYLAEKYNLGFAQVGTFQKFKTKNAIKDTMFAVFGRNRGDREMMDICESIPDSPQGLDEYDFLYGYIDSEGVQHRGLLEQNPTLQAFFKQYPEVEEIVSKLLGLPKEFGRHPSAFILSTLDLAEKRVPIRLVNDPKIGGAVRVSQYDAPMVEKVGLVKADVLMVTTIDTISSCVALIKERTGLDLLEEDERGVQLLYKLPEDTGVYGDFYKRLTDSSFQFNTDLIKSRIQDFAPICRKDLSDLTALCRPGALDVEFKPGISATQFYINVRSGRSEPEYLHEDLKPILGSTNGVVTYQEQLMEILVAFCGYSLEESDQIRSAIAKKKRDVMVKAFERVREATLRRGWTAEQAEKLCSVLEAYSNYSFNLSHSRAYAELGYITMWLKHHYPLEWWTAELNLSSEEKLRRYISTLGKLVTPPSLKSPSGKFTIVGDRIAAPLWAVKGLGPATITTMVNNGPFETLQDLAKKCGSKFNAAHFGAMLKARALDCIMDKTLSYADAKKKLLEEWKAARKGKTSFSSEVTTSNPLEMFRAERDTLKTFNKVLLHDDGVMDLARKTWPAIRLTGKREIVAMMGEGEAAVPILESVAAADRLLAKHSDSEIEVGIVGLFQASSSKSGVSKKSGRRWSKVDVVISDGVSTIECVWWDRKKPLRLPVDSLIYARGILKKDWRGKPSIVLEEVVRSGEFESQPEIA